MAIETLFGQGGEWIKAARFIRPAGLNPVTGVFAGAEISAVCLIACMGGKGLTLAMPKPGDERILVRASELSELEEPGENDRIVETDSGLVRRVLAGRLDVTGQYWIFQCERTRDEDLGDLVAAVTAEDRGDLGATVDKEERGGLFQ